MTVGRPATKRTRSREPFFWALFSSGGTLAALLLPAHFLLLCLAGPLGWVELRSREGLLALAGHPLGRIYLGTLATLCLFHWAHRFRYTLYDGLQLKHLNEMIAVFCYGGAAAGSVAAILVLAALP